MVTDAYSFLLLFGFRSVAIYMVLQYCVSRKKNVPTCHW